MAAFNVAFPVLPGKEEAFREWAKEVAGPRKDDFTELNRRGGLTRETFTLQTTPMGSFMLLWVEGDVERAFQDVAIAQDEFTVWQRGKLLEVTGVDMTQPAEGAGPEVLFDWHG
jgi:hypothetical protein